MRILRILKRVARVPKVWWQLQKLHQSLKKEGVKITSAKNWATGVKQMNAAEITQIHTLAAIFSPWTTCLRRSILLSADLKANNYPAVWKQGIRKDTNGKVQMHAWVEVEGKLVADEREFVETFQPIDLPLQ